MARLLRLLVILVAALVTLPASAFARESTTPVQRTQHYYLSLGDSLAVGVQPIGMPPFFETDEGYADQVYAALKAHDPKLRLSKLGCGGESTVSMRFGSQLPEAAASCGSPGFYRHRYPHKTQLAEAVHFLRAHGKHVALVTIEIGGNDVTGPSGVEPILANLPVILSELRKAAGPGVPIVGMNYFDPFLPLAWAEGGLPAVQTEVDAVIDFNDLLEGLYHAAGNPVADVEQAFGVTDLTLVDGTPANVVRACAWTWICAPPPFGQDIHPNAVGYGAIAQAFVDVPFS